MPMLSATIPTGRTIVAAEKDLMATEATAMVTTMSLYLFFPLLIIIISIISELNSEFPAI